MAFPIHHLPGIESHRIRSRRLETDVLTHGPAEGQPVLMLHGNLSAGRFWEETMTALPSRFFGAAPDMRGYCGSDPSATIDATRGFGDWADDAMALADAFGWDCFHLVAHSLGGCIAWAMMGRRAERLLSVTLVAPGPPCGFGGARGSRGELNHPDGAGSGAGLAHPKFVEGIAAGQRDVTDDFFSPRAAMNRLMWNPPFRPEREEAFLAAMLGVHLGEARFPGDQRKSPHWPGFAPGAWGPVNAMSPAHNQHVLAELLAARHKPPILWAYGEADAIICDNSASDAGTQGMLGLRPDWPGEQEFPPQPLRRQVAYALEQYEQLGGSVTRLAMPGVGHSPHIEQPEEFQAALCDQLQRGSV